MNEISDEIISIEEARAVLKNMRLCSFDEEEALECFESFVHRIRNISMAKLVEEIVEKKLSETQKQFFKDYWYSEKNTVQIAKEHNVSQANVHKTLTRANETLKEFLTPLIMYHKDLRDVQLRPLVFKNIGKIISAKNCENKSLSQMLRGLRISEAVTPEDLAKAMCITVAELNLIENGEKMPTPEILKSYSRVFGVEIISKFSKGKGEYEWRKI